MGNEVVGLEQDFALVSGETCEGSRPLCKGTDCIANLIVEWSFGEFA